MNVINLGLCCFSHQSYSEQLGAYRIRRCKERWWSCCTPVRIEPYQSHQIHLHEQERNVHVVTYWILPISGV